MTSTLLPDCAIKLPAAQAEEGPMAGDGKKLIRNTAAEFLIFTGQASGQGVEARPEDESVWLPQKLMAELCALDVRTVSEHLKNIY
jgi:hypothetical protein